MDARQPVPPTSPSHATSAGGGGGASARKTASSGHHNNYSPSSSVAASSNTNGNGTVRRPVPPSTQSPLSPSSARTMVATGSKLGDGSATAPSAPPLAKTAPLAAAKPKPKPKAKLAAKRKPYRPPLTKKQLIILKQILREEEVARLELETQEAAEFTALGVSMQQSMMKLVNAHVQSGGEMLAMLQMDNEHQRSVNAEARVVHNDILQTVSVTSTVLKAFVDYHSSAEREYVRRLEIENGIMRRQLDAKDVEISRQFAEIEGLRDSLSRLIIRTDVENEVYRREVKEQIARNATDVAEMKKRLQQRIDETVVAIHKPQFQSNLKTLKDLVEEEQFKVQQSADELRYLVDQIGAEDRFMPRSAMTMQQRLVDERGVTAKLITGAKESGYAGVSQTLRGGGGTMRDDSSSAAPLSAEEVAHYVSSSTMHTNFPRFYRDQLQGLPKAALLRILDVVSFEPRVVTAVGQALTSIATDQHVAEMEEEEEEEMEEDYDEGADDGGAEEEVRRIGYGAADATPPAASSEDGPPVAPRRLLVNSGASRADDSIRDDDGGEDLFDGVSKEPREDASQPMTRVEGVV